MFSSFKLSSLRIRKNSEGADGKSSSRTPLGTPLLKRRNRRGSESTTGCPSVAALRPGSVAHGSDLLAPGDQVLSVNGLTTQRLRPDETTTILDSVQEQAVLDVAYTLPDYGVSAAASGTTCVATRVASVALERGPDGSLGITLRGGARSDVPQLSRPLVITHVRQDGPAHRCGVIKIGDRLIRVDGTPLNGRTLSEAQTVLGTSVGAGVRTTLTIEYDVHVMESIRHAAGPLLVEVERRPHEDLGLILADVEGVDGVFVQTIRSASIADRCGAIHVGDQILAVDDVSVDATTSAGEVSRMLQSSRADITRLHVLPRHCVNPRATHLNSSPMWGRMSPNLRTTDMVPGSPSLSGFSTMNSRRSRHPLGSQRHFNRQCNPSRVSPNIDQGFGISHCGYNTQLGVCHSETLNTILCSDGNGYGITVGTDTSSSNEQAYIVITDIEVSSVADRSGCLQAGDRLLSINRQPNLTVQEINSLLERGCNNSAKLELQVEFDVADTIVPTSGIFTVKLARHSSGLGITITASKTNSDEPFTISEIRKGSIAHRIGSLHIGDRLLAIDGKTLSRSSLDSAFEALTESDIVTLRVEKVEAETKSYIVDDVVYTVELVRYGGPLGITISGSEDCMEPIVLSKLVEGGLAEKTGALHVGDRILAINGENLINRPLSDAIRLLQCSSDRVQLKISRQVKEPQHCEEPRSNYPSPGVQSVDSAVASWNGSTVTDTKMDNNNLVAEENNQQTVEKLPEENKLSMYEAESHKTESIQYYSDTEDTFCPSPLPLPNYSYTLQNKLNISPARQITKPKQPLEDEIEADRSQTESSFELSSYGFDSSNYDIYHVILYKDSVYDDYGFSVSDGLYEKGVYINRIRKGGPADIVGLLKPFDRILQVNDTKTQEFDCCLTVPLIASAGDRIDLVVARNPNNDTKDMQVLSWITEEQEMFNMCAGYNMRGSQSTITKTL